jgi:hypothetical protein
MTWKTIRYKTQNSREKAYRLLYKKKRGMVWRVGDKGIMYSTPGY